MKTYCSFNVQIMKSMDTNSSCKMSYCSATEKLNFKIKLLSVFQHPNYFRLAKTVMQWYCNIYSYQPRKARFASKTQVHTIHWDTGTASFTEKGKLESVNKRPNLPPREISCPLGRQTNSNPVAFSHASQLNHLFPIESDPICTQHDNLRQGKRSQPPRRVGKRRIKKLCCSC